jgi:alkanesulfonate monooxygenase SsuD/methylene tetrahydromethanopterin reductase-like flavin-dependent oxidoreductase (luciferase family)
MRRTVEQVRALLRGDRMPLAVTTGARPLKLNLPPAPALPIYLAALGDASVRLAGELADGWSPFLYPRRHLGYGVERLREGAARGGHPERLPLVSPSVPAVVSEDPSRAREGAAWFAAFYIVSMGTLYRQSLARQGFGKQVEAVLAANTPKFTGASSASGGRGGAARAAAATEPESRGAGVHAGRPAAARRRGVRSAPWSRAR